jgi:hypothetical protein
LKPKEKLSILILMVYVMVSNTLFDSLKFSWFEEVLELHFHYLSVLLLLSLLSQVASGFYDLALSLSLSFSFLVVFNSPVECRKRFQGVR